MKKVCSESKGSTHLLEAVFSHAWSNLRVIIFLNKT